jgi:chemotaxis protein methyltransferase CheR
MDLVMMRNVLIYFDVETKRDILRRTRELLRPGGCVFLGTAETTLNLDSKFLQRHTERTTYFEVAPNG